LECGESPGQQWCVSDLKAKVWGGVFLRFFLSKAKADGMESRDQCPARLKFATIDYTNVPVCNVISAFLPVHIGK
jgi:hypothetical protein